MSSYNKFLDSLTDKQKNYLIRKVQYGLNKLKKSVIDDQTIIFWNLQLQFLSMESNELAQFTPFKIAHKAIKVKNESLKEYVATELALYLSGLK